MTLPRPAALRATVVIVLAVLFGFDERAFADPPGPTDYRTEILEVDPPTTSISFAVIGGDSFLELTVEPGTAAEVIGYRGEPYLWFQSDGTVLENRNSPSTYLNRERYGTESPDFATADAEPDWVEVGSDGRWAWHDHRAHLMQSFPPPGTAPGDRVLENVMLVRVDGETVAVTVISTWQPAPSSVPQWTGVVVAFGSLGLAALLWRRTALWALAVVPITLIAATVGWWQYRSFPAETAPRLTWWVFPTIAGLAVGAAVIAGLRNNRFLVSAAMILAGAQLAIWGYTKRDGLSAAIVPTDAPGWLDRFSTSGAFLAGVGVVLITLWEFFGPRELNRPD